MHSKRKFTVDQAGALTEKLVATRQHGYCKVLVRTMSDGELVDKEVEEVFSQMLSTYVKSLSNKTK